MFAVIRLQKHSSNILTLTTTTTDLMKEILNVFSRVVNKSML